MPHDVSPRTGTIITTITIGDGPGGAADRSRRSTDNRSTDCPAPSGGVFCFRRFLTSVTLSSELLLSPPSDRRSRGTGRGGGAPRRLNDGLHKARRARARGHTGRRERRSADGRFHERCRARQDEGNGFATFYSRSRQKLWTKGETSGNKLAVQQILVDCDDDTVLLKVKRLGDGNVCHTGDPDLFHSALEQT